MFISPYFIMLNGIPWLIESWPGRPNLSLPIRDVIRISWPLAYELFVWRREERPATGSIGQRGRTRLRINVRKQNSHQCVTFVSEHCKCDNSVKGFVFTLCCQRGITNATAHTRTHTHTLQNMEVASAKKTKEKKPTISYARVPPVWNGFMHIIHSRSVICPYVVKVRV